MNKFNAEKAFYQFILVLWITFILLLIFFLHNSILYRASTSLEIKCFPKKNLTDYNIAGSFNPSTGEIKIYQVQRLLNISKTTNLIERERIINKTYISNPSSEDTLTAAEMRTLRHEKTHQRQYREGRLATCKNPIKVYLNEIEAYLSEYVP